MTQKGARGHRNAQLPPSAWPTTRRRGRNLAVAPTRVFVSPWYRARLLGPTGSHDGCSGRLASGRPPCLVSCHPSILTKGQFGPQVSIACSFAPMCAISTGSMTHAAPVHWSIEPKKHCPFLVLSPRLLRPSRQPRLAVFARQPTRSPVAMTQREVPGEWKHGEGWNRCTSSHRRRRCRGQVRQLYHALQFLPPVVQWQPQVPGGGHIDERRRMRRAIKTMTRSEKVHL